MSKSIPAKHTIEASLRDGDSVRRKVRKGTQSCWECKRRKVRCAFATSADLSCDGCKRRRTECVSQEFPDASATIDSTSQLCDKVDHLETKIRSLTQRVDLLDGREDHLSHRIPDTGVLEGVSLLTRKSGEVNSRRVILNAIANQDLGHLNQPGYNSDRPQQDQVSIQPRLLPNPLLESENISWRWGCESTVNHESLSYYLLKAWPSQHDLETILRLPEESYGLLHGVICAPVTPSLFEKISSIRENLKLPRSASHPVLIARALLVLATYLQCLSPACTQYLNESNIDHQTMMSSAVETVRGYVTCTSEFLESIEGVECMMMESMYMNNAGQLRKAWHTIRRAILIAQLMGLHQSTMRQSVRYLEVETRTRVDPEYMWFRLMQMDRYLTMMLGLLQGTPNNSFADQEILENCSPVDRMQRMDCAAAGYILQCNESRLFDLATVRTIDHQLQTSAASLPPSWWLMPNFHSSSGSEMETLEKIIRTMDQLTHYHLVTRLHMPYLIRPHTDHQYDYSKIVAVDASREILARFTSMSSVHAFAAFCRGISLLAFIACTTLCLVHIGVKHQRQIYTCDSVSAFLDLLKHQRLKDQGLMELTLDCMKSMACNNIDPIADRTAIMLEYLLSVEAEAVICEKTETSISKEDCGHAFGCESRMSECGQVLHISIPYIGTITFKKGGAPTSTAIDQHSGLNDCSSRKNSEHFLGDPSTQMDHLHIRRVFDDNEHQHSYVSDPILESQLGSTYTRKMPQLPSQATHQDSTSSSTRVLNHSSTFSLDVSHATGS